MVTVRNRTGARNLKSFKFSESKQHPGSAFPDTGYHLPWLEVHENLIFNHFRTQHVANPSVGFKFNFIMQWKLLTPVTQSWATDGSVADLI